jgi:small subunit ribosomal protein S1
VEEAEKLISNWDRALSIYRQDEIVAMRVAGYNRGGLLVEGNELNGFVPCSHLVDLPPQPDETHREDCLTAYVGRTLRLKVIECVPEEGRMVFSERAARAEAGKRPALFSSIHTGQHVSGDVTNVTDFGVFVDLGGVEGLIHISELSWGRVAHPNQVCRVGQHVDVLVMEVAPERCRIALSLKRLIPNPWEKAQERYPVNKVVPAVVTALVQFGAFARLEEGLEGLIHASEIPMPANGVVKDCVSPGESVLVRILQVDAHRQRIGLSMKID